MARSDIFFESFLSYYSTLALDSIALWRSTREEIRNDSLDFRRVCSRMASLWTDAYEGWWSALLSTATPPLPTLLLACPADSGAHANSIRLQVPGNRAPSLTTVARVDDGKPLAAEARVEVTAFRDQITVYLSNMRNPAPGTYHGLIYLDQLPLALLVVEIQAAGDDGGPTRGRGSRSARPGKRAKKKR